jgi:hypothetical protein
MLALRTLIVKRIDNLVTQSSDVRLTTTVGTASSRGLQRMDAESKNQD